MEWLIYCICTGILIAIFVQDIRFRAIAWPLFPLSLASLILLQYFASGGLENFAQNVSMNICYLLLNLFFLFFYFYLKRVSVKKMLTKYIAHGDLLFFGVLALGLSFPVFPVFFILSLLVSLMLAPVIFLNKTVPLAGLQALLAVVLISAQQFNIISEIDLNII